MKAGSGKHFEQAYNAQAAVASIKIKTQHRLQTAHGREVYKLRKVGR